MKWETPAVRPERGWSQTAARMLARALNLLKCMVWQSAASWDNSRSGCLVHNRCAGLIAKRPAGQCGAFCVLFASSAGDYAPTVIRLGLASSAFGSVTVKTPSL